MEHAFDHACESVQTNFPSILDPLLHLYTGPNAKRLAGDTPWSPVGSASLTLQRLSSGLIRTPGASVDHEDRESPTGGRLDAPLLRTSKYISVALVSNSFLLLLVRHLLLLAWHLCPQIGRVGEVNRMSCHQRGARSRAVCVTPRSRLQP